MIRPAAGGSGCRHPVRRIRALDGVTLHVPEAIGGVDRHQRARAKDRRSCATFRAIQPALEGTYGSPGSCHAARHPARVRAGLAQSGRARVFGPMSVETNLLLGGYLSQKAEVAQTQAVEHAYNCSGPADQSAARRPEMLSRWNSSRLSDRSPLMSAPKLLSAR